MPECTEAEREFIEAAIASRRIRDHVPYEALNKVRSERLTPDLREGYICATLAQLRAGAHQSHVGKLVAAAVGEEAAYGEHGLITTLYREAEKLFEAEQPKQPEPPK